MIQIHPDTARDAKAAEQARKAAEKADRAVARYEAKAQKAVDKAQLRATAPLQLKERVIHTRVPAALEEKLKAHAERLRVPVSNLIRIILEDAVAGPLELRRTEDRAVVTASPSVLGYQPFLPSVPGVCHRCGAAVEAGSEAFLGLTDSPGPRLMACSSCVAASPASAARRTG